jgi:hypothetical protein
MTGGEYSQMCEYFFYLGFLKSDGVQRRDVDGVDSCTLGLQRPNTKYSMKKLLGVLLNLKQQNSVILLPTLADRTR